MEKKKIGLGLAFSKLLHSTKRGILEGRMKQNIKLCRKYNVPLVIGSYATRPYEMRSPHDLATYFMGLGMQPHHIKEGREHIGKVK